MSDNIPLEIQVEIIKRLPVKLLLEFRSVSKTWKSLIDSSHFIKHYKGQQQHLLVRYYGQLVKYVSVVDDHTFPQVRRVSLNLPPLVKKLKRSKVIGSSHSHGMLCLFGRSDLTPGAGGKVAVLWNISIRKAVAIAVPNERRFMMDYQTDLGFGVCRETTDPKIVKVTQINSWSNMERISSIPRSVEVFTLSTPVWRSPKSNLPHESIRFGYFKVFVDGFLYWLATERIRMDDGFRFSSLIISFDMTTEEFREVDLPDSLASQPFYNLSIFKLSESLVVLECGVDAAHSRVFYVWMMEDDVPKTFTKQFTINVNTPNGTVYGFRKNGEPIIEIVEDVGTRGMHILFSVYPYMETLLLLDQQDLTVYNGT